MATLVRRFPGIISTRGKSKPVSFLEAVEGGIASDGGLTVPEVIPAFHHPDEKSILPTLAKGIASLYFASDRLEEIVRESFNFPLPVRPISENLFLLELFHGPSFSFKDFGARFLARLLGGSEKKRIVLTATSGDTGSAVAQGFYGLPNVRVVILYPDGKISPLQEKQMTTLGKNIFPLAVDGTFDDCQRRVKEAFLLPELRGKNLTSANSINIGRWLAQTFYYFYAAQELVHLRLPKSPRIVCAVPSGNLGNLAAGVLAKRMGCNLHRFIAAMNINDPLGPWYRNGKGEEKKSVSTDSNAMDVGSPSNLERLIWLYGGNQKQMHLEINCAVISDATARKTMRTYAEEFGILIDPHTAVGLAGWEKERRSGEMGLVLATAHPAKFPETVFQATGISPELPLELKRVAAKSGKKRKLPNSLEALTEFLESL